MAFRPIAASALPAFSIASGYAAPAASIVAAAPAATYVSTGHAAAFPVAAVAAAPVAAVAAAPVAVAAAAPVAVAAAPVAVAAAVAPCALAVPALPPVNGCCYAPPPVAAGINTAKQVQLPTELRVVETNDGDLQTIVRDNNHHTQFNKTVVTQVNRNHLHTQRVVTNENFHNLYVTNNVTKVNDIHRQRVEHVPGERRVFNNHRQTQVVEPAQCLRAVDGAVVPCAQL